jgi:soluble lytic murein transglycosylase-like protein
MRRAAAGRARRTRLGRGADAGPRARPRRCAATARAGGAGQATLPAVGVLLALLLGALVLGGVARGLAVHGERRRAADLAALAAARAMRDAQARVFTPAWSGGRPDPAHLERAAYLAIGRRVAVQTARRNGARDVAVTFPGAAGQLAPVRVAVTVRDPIRVAGRSLADAVTAEAELVPPGAGLPAGPPGAGEYRGPFAKRQGKRIRPDVAAAFDRMAAAARAAGHALLITSAFRGDAEQAALFAARPDPKWVARPGTSLHRLGTELDLGPASAYAWLAANAPRFHFKQRYAWESWHFGYVLNAGTASLGYPAGAERALPSFVPAAYAPAIARAAQRWNVAGNLLAAQILQESHFNPFATSPAGARGIAQFMPGTARDYGLGDPFDAAAAIDAQARLMRDLLRQFGAVPLALAAYNAGPRRVAACGCVPPIPETQAYVAAILGLLQGAGDPAAGALAVRLVR